MNRRALLTGLAALPSAALAETDPELYWRRIREEQFSLPHWRVFLNNGSLGITPKPVVAAMKAFIDRSAALDIEEYPRWGYERMDEHRKALAEFVGCNPDELALTHNATEAISLVAQGLDLKTGDEVLMTDQEHPSGRGAWSVRAARHGIVVRQVPIPIPPKSPEQLADLMISAIGPRTKVLCFSGITTSTGLIMPVREICRAARAKGVLTLVDGAHMHGQIPFRIDEMDCDFMAASPHKWLFAPAGCGFLYIRREHQDRVFPSVTTDGWVNSSLAAARFMLVGTNNRAIFEGMMAGLQFAKEIGPERIMKRMHQLARMVRDRAAKEPSLRILTPDDDRLFGCMVSLQLQPEHAKRFASLCKERRMWTLAGERFRVSTHIHTRPADIDALFQAIVDSKA